jgi:Bacterial Ig domain
MTIRAEPQSVWEHAPIRCKPLDHTHQFWQQFSTPICRALRQGFLKKSLRLLAVTFSLAGASFAGVTISSPQNGATVTSPVHVVATASSSSPITSMRIYVDNVSVFAVSASKIDKLVNMGTGPHMVVVQAWNSAGTVFKAQITITVGTPPPATPTPTPATSGVTISSPANGATVASPVHVAATASSSSPITSMRIYVDSVSVFAVSANRIDTLVNMATGPHTVVVQAWNSVGAVFKSQIAITVGTAPPPPTTGVTVATPRNGATLASPIHVVASAFSANPITAMRIYLDGVSVFANTTNKIDTSVNAATGLHNLTVQAWDSKGTVFKTPLSVSVNQTTTLSAETGNNTSAADSFAAQSNGNAAAGNVSKVATRTLFYPGSTAKIYAHFMPWFGSDKHFSVGYASDDSLQIKKQVTDMVSRGLNGVILDWYGFSSDGTDFLMEDHVVQLMMQEAESKPGFTFAVMYDQGALQACIAKNPNCNVTQRVIDDLNHANVSYWGSPAYQKSGGRPVVYFFFDSTTYAVDWARVRTDVAGNPLLFFSHATGFTHAQSDGAFAWIKPELATSTDPATIGYLSDYYNTATSSSMLSTGSAFPGFDDSLAPWGKHRKVNQQCGKTWLQTLDEAKNHYSSTNQMSGIQLVTWNDYEEGTEIESGIDNCVTVNASVTGTVVSWNISGDAATLDHFSLYVSLPSGSLLWLKDVPVTTRSTDLAQFNLNAGSYLAYVKAVAKPSLTNKMSSGVQLTVR